MTSSSSSSPDIPPANPADPQNRFSYKNATHDEVLEDLSSRFILNLPDEELASLERICFQVEQAHWFYEDFIREENPKFPSLPLKKFSAMLFHACPLLHQWSHDHEQAFTNFMQYKTRVPVCGAIMLNDTWEKCLLVKGWKASSGWGFPKGKINEDEPEPNCAIREVLEETGYNLAGQINPDHVIEMSIKEQRISLYIVPGIPEDFPFKTRTRKEISKIEWFKLTDLPTWKRSKASLGKFYLISPFIGALKAFINERKPRGPVRKMPKAQSSRSANSRTDSKESQTSLSHRDQTQESGSRSSSAGDGSPQTPSPLYSEPVANSVMNHPNVVEHDVSKAIATEAMDPQLARLLTSLSLSASGLTHARKDPPALAVKTDEVTPSEPTTPVPTSAITASSAHSHSRSGSKSEVEWWSSSSCLPNKPVTPSHARRYTTETSPFSSRHRSTSSSSSSFPNSASFHTKLPLPNSTLPADQTNRMDSQSGDQPSSAGSSSAPSSRLSSRRSSSITDISPYLMRPADIPISGRRLKQLALLESVADESARMTPVLRKRESSHSGSPGFNLTPSNNRQSFAFGNFTTLPPPPPQANDPNDLRVIYSSNFGPISASSSMTSSAVSRPLHESQYQLDSDNPFQVRPRSSVGGQQLVTLSQNTSLNQDQMLPIVNGPRQSDLQRPPHIIQTQSRLGFYPTPPPPPSFQIDLPASVSNYRHSFAGLQSMCLPILSGSAVAPPQEHDSTRVNNMQLLSILNGDPNAVMGSSQHPP